jgi:hypothetical protein
MCKKCVTPWFIHGPSIGLDKAMFSDNARIKDTTLSNVTRVAY